MLKSDYKQIFDQISPPPELVARAKEAQAPARRRSRHMAGRIIAAAAAACLVVGLGTSFAMVETIDPLSTKLETWFAAGLETPVGVSDSSMGWTITVDSVLGDSWYAYILCTLSRDDGQAIVPGDYGFHNWEFSFPDGTTVGGSSGIHWFTDEDLTDNKVPFGFQLSTMGSQNLLGAPIHMKLNGLNTTDLAESWAMMVGRVDWELEFTMPSESHAETFHPGLSIQLSGGEVVLDTVQVSPMELLAEFSGPEGEEVLLALSPFQLQDDWAAASPRFILADGTELLWTGGGIGGADFWTGGFPAPEGRILTPEDIVGLKLEDTVYPLNLE